MEQIPELTRAFTSAVTVALAEMAGVECVLLHSAIAVPDANGLMVVLRLTGTTEGSLRLRMSDATATALAGRILATSVPNPDVTMIRDCMGEVANIIAGQAKTLLYGTPLHFSFSTPLLEESVVLSPGLCLKFGMDVGELTVIVHPPS